jgi:rhodanese-related sulfurtransferase
MSHAAFSEPIPQMTVQELSQRLQDLQQPVQLIDVREPQEVEIASVKGFTVLPLSQFQQWSSDIYHHFEPEVETLVICHHGMRSQQMCQWLRSQGFTNVKNIVGGIEAYSVYIDPHVPRY